MNLQEIKERERKATPGFWVNMGEHNSDSVFFGEIRCGGTQEQEAFILIAVMPKLDDRTDDFNFIAHAREDIPALVAEVERLQIRLRNLQNQMQIDGHEADCAAVQAASVDCSCGARQTNLIERLYEENKRLKAALDEADKLSYVPSSAELKRATKAKS